MGKMGAGIALKIRKKWPVVYEQYLSECLTGKMQLGTVQIVQITSGLYVANIAGQYGYGRDKRYTDYKAFWKCLVQLEKISKKAKLQIYIPYKIGCVNAGGDWSIVRKYINESITNPVICKL